MPLACIHFCPVATIQVQGKRTRMRGRYQHPHVRADDITGQKDDRTNTQG